MGLKKKLKLSSKKLRTTSSVTNETSLDDLFEDTPTPKESPSSDSRKKLSLTLSKKALSRDFVLKNPEIKGATTTHSPGRGGTDRIQLTIDAATGNLQIGDLLMECVSLRNTIPDWPIEQWIAYLNSTGAVPFYILAGDQDRYHLAIYAAEYVHRNATAEQKTAGLKWLPRGPVRDLNQVQEKMDGRTWGGVDDTLDDTVRGQVLKAKTDNIDSHRLAMTPAEYVDEASLEQTPYMLKWEMAEKHARDTPRSEWENKLDFAFESMVKYCYHWIRDIGEVPEYPDNYQDLFWPMSRRTEQDEEGKVRRTRVVGKLIDFWRKNLAKSPEGINLKSTSYRTVLAAKNLEYLIEKYAINHKWKTGDSAVDDKELEQRIRLGAVTYFQAHFPIVGAEPGPIETLDPGYADYVRLCRKYKLEEGVLLHEAKL